MTINKFLPAILRFTLLVTSCLIHCTVVALSGNVVASGDLASSNILSGSWESAKMALRETDCCVVSVTGLDEHLQVLQDAFVDNGPSDVDLRSRIRTAEQGLLTSDCRRISQSVLDAGKCSVADSNAVDDKADRTIAALEELARGVAWLADGPLMGTCTDVHMRIVCASDYRAIDPMFHTDKAPLRGYVTLRGVGTEFMTRTCTPMEYMKLRSGGMQEQGTNEEPSKSVRAAQELEFIVMKGDYYPQQEVQPKQSSWQLLSKFWQRTYACVHRSPPGKGGGGRRVILSLDLADGDDDREWYQARQKREWRSGMTQRKSHLVA